MTDRCFHDALRAARTPLEFVYAVADQPLWDERPEIDEQELLDERDAVVVKARAFQRPLDDVLLAIVPLLQDARAQLARDPSDPARAGVVDRIDAAVDRLSGAVPQWSRESELSNA